MKNQEVLSASREVSLGTQSVLSLFVRMRKTNPSAFFYQAPALGSQPPFAIIGLGVEEVVRVSEGQTEVISSEGRRTLPGDPSLALAHYIQSLNLPERPGVPFASGGLFGACGYDFVQYLEPILRKSGYFAEPPKSKSVQLELQLSLRLIVINLNEKSARVVSGNRRGDAAAIETDLQKICQQIAASEPVLPQAAQPVPDSVFQDSELEASLGKEKYCAHVKTLKEHIRAGDIFQAVLAETFVFRTPSSPIDIFQALYERAQTPFYFYMELQGSTLLGASPEALVRVDHERIETNPIAGTRPRGQTSQEDARHEQNLKRSPKEQAEHLMLVDLARNDLGRISKPGTVVVEKYAELKKFSHVMHLTSNVSGQLDTAHFTVFDSFKSCFPVGTVSGAPKVRAMQILSNLETQPRGFYGGGFLAMDTHHYLDSSLLIRTLEMLNGQVVLRAGAGIVADSDPEREYQEVENKLRGIKNALAAVEFQRRRSIS